MIYNPKAHEDALKAEEESRRTTLCDFVMDGSRRHHGELFFKKVFQHLKAVIVLFFFFDIEV